MKRNWQRWPGNSHVFYRHLTNVIRKRWSQVVWLSVVLLGAVVAITASALSPPASVAISSGGTATNSEIPKVSEPWLANTFAPDDAVEVLWEGRWWPARVLETQAGNFCITYEGFDSSWDECVDSSRIRALSTPADMDPRRLYEIGFSHLINGNYLEAIESLEASIELFDPNDLEDSVYLERALSAISTAYSITGNSTALEAAARQHLELAKQTNDPSAATIALTRLGNAAFERGEYL